YSNQYHGAIEWLTRTHRAFINSFADPSQAVDSAAAQRLRSLRRRLTALWMFRTPSAIVEGKWRKPKKSVRDWLILLAGAPLCLISKPVDRYLRIKAHAEWR